MTTRRFQFLLLHPSAIASPPRPSLSQCRSLRFSKVQLHRAQHSVGYVAHLSVEAAASTVVCCFKGVALLLLADATRRQECT